MSPEEIIEALEANLVAERIAIVALDSERVSELGEAKDRLVSLLAETAVPRELAPRLREIVTTARYNCLLVAHARESLRGAAAVVASQVSKAAMPADDLPRRGVRVSVTG